MSIVVDANLIAALILPLPYSESSRMKISEWKQAGEMIFAPTLWEYELVTALRRAILQGMVDGDQVSRILKKIEALNIGSVQPSEYLHSRALSWANRLAQSRAYDSQYLALAEHAGAEFWTGDKRRANGARSVGLDWVFWVGGGS